MDNIFLETEEFGWVLSCGRAQNKISNLVTIKKIRTAQSRCVRTRDLNSRTNVSGVRYLYDHLTTYDIL